MTNAFAGLIIRLDTADVSISDLEHNSIETLKTEKNKSYLKRRTAYPRKMGHYKWCNIQIKGILGEERKNKKRNT